MAKRTNYKPLDERLWKFLRQGLAYLETSGKPVPTTYVHPGGYAYGPLGLTNIAVQDVQRFFAEPERLTLKDIIKQPAIYEDYARKYADILLNHYLGGAGIDYTQLSPTQIFDILQRMWFLGPTGYQQGKKIPLSRQKKAQEWMMKPTPEQIRISRKKAIQSVIKQGITNPKQLYDILNYDEQGNKIGDITFEEIMEELKEKAKEFLATFLR